MKTYVVADLAGRYAEVLKLFAQFEQPCQIVCVGDVVDRGSQSKELVEYLMAHPEFVVIFGNHEALMLEAHGRFHPGLDYPPDFEPDPETWLSQGGLQTLASFGGQIPAEVLTWAANLPLNHEVEIDSQRYYISHAPVPDPDWPWKEKPERIWNRNQPLRNPKYALQIYGHNSKMDWVADNDGTYAVCIDDCRNKHLTAIELPSLRILHQPYEATK